LFPYTNGPSRRGHERQSKECQEDTQREKGVRERIEEGTQRHHQTTQPGQRAQRAGHQQKGQVRLRKNTQPIGGTFDRETRAEKQGEHRHPRRVQHRWVSGGKATHRETSEEVSTTYSTHPQTQKQNPQKITNIYYPRIE